MPEPARPPLGRDFVRLFLAGTISSAGDGVTFVAAPLLAATITRDPRLVAGIDAAVTLPFLLWSLPVGALVDRWNRRRVMWIADALRAVIIGAIAVAAATGTTTLPLLYVAFFLLGSGQVFFDNANQAALPMVVEPAGLERANARLQAGTIGAGQLLGPALGSLLFAAAVAAPFAFDATTFAISALLCATLRGSLTARRAVAADTSLTPGSAAPATSLRSEIAEGLRWLARHRLLRTLALVLGAMNLLDVLARSTFVLFAQDRMHLSGVGYGLVFTVGSIGGVVGGVVADRIATRLPRQILAIVVAAMALSYLVVPLTSSPVVAAAAFFVSGTVSVLWNVVTVSARQQIIPARLFARVNSVYRLLAWGSMPLGAAIGGIAAHRLGLAAPWWIAAAGHLVLLVVAGRSLHRGRIDEARAAALDDDAAVSSPSGEPR